MIEIKKNPAANDVFQEASKNAVVYCVDENPDCNALLASSLLTLQDKTRADVIVMTCPKNRFASALKKQFPWVHIIDVSKLAYEFLNEEDIVNTNEEHKLSTSTYWRLLMFKDPHFISYEKILYLDCDTLVLRDLDQSIFSIDINSARLLACPENFYYRNPKHDLLRQISQRGLGIFIDQSIKYFNAGVLLFNMQKIDRQAVFETCIQLAHMNFTWHDQDVLNIVFDDFTPMPSAFNSCVGTDELCRQKNNIAIEHMCDDVHAKIPRARIGHQLVQMQRDASSRIPKNLFFIWIGEKMPEWAQKSVNAFAEANPDFNVKVVYERSTSFLQDKDAVECMKLIRESPDSLYAKAWRNPKNLINQSKQFDGIRFSDVLRFYLLDKYGGIYLDCDTFPVKPFDDLLLQNEFFACRSFIGKNDIYDDICAYDIFFIGSMPGKAFHYYKGYDSKLKPNAFNLLKEEALYEYTDRNFAEYESLGHDLKYIKGLHHRYYDGMPMSIGIDRMHLKHDWKNRERNYYVDHYNRKSWL